jgi:DNA mismatch endonuclease (patch repair protein)
LRKALWANGVRYRKNVRALPGNPDIVIRRARVVVFCDGDFWHGKDWGDRQRKLQQGSNASYWMNKIAGNIERDRRINESLETSGWTVLRFWESEILEETAGVVSRLKSVLESGSRPNVVKSN